MVRLFRSSIGVLFFAITAAFSIGLPPAALADDNANVNVAAYAHKPEVMLNTGAATYSVPIQVPPGRRGMTPKLAFTYSSYRGNGWLGMGWDIGVGEIVRTNDPLIDYAADEFEIRSPAVNDKLAPYNGYYREKSDTSFTRYHIPDPNSSGWTVEYRDGSVAYFGTTEASREYNDLGISRWCLDKIEDPHGNSIVYSYGREDGHLYLGSIQYVEIDGGYLNRIQFWNESSNDRPDVIVRHASGSPEKITKRLGSIIIEQDGVWLRRYSCIYESGLYLGDRSRLKSIHISAREAADNSLPEKSLPPIEFGYTDRASGFGDETTLEFKEPVTSQDVFSGTPYFADVDGDGRKDLLVKKDSDLHFYVAEADGSFSFVNTLSLESDDFSVQDYDGDGRVDVQMQDGDALELFDLKCDPTTSEISILSNPKIAYGPLADLGNDKEHLFLDINNDGYLDVVRSIDVGSAISVEAWLYHPETDGIERTYHGNLSYSPQFKDVNGDGWVDFYLDSRTIYLGDGIGDFHSNSSLFGDKPKTLDTGDINGDGLIDVVGDNFDQSYIWMADGRGGMEGYGTSNYNNRCRNKTVFDINGDGLADIVQMNSEDNFLLIFLSNGDGTFTSLAKTDGIDLDATLANNAFADINGDGQIDIIVCDKDGERMTVRTYLAQGDGKANLLNSVDKGRGTTVSLAYGESGQVSNTYVPFYLIPVTSRTVVDEFSDPEGARTTYAYQGGMYDPVKKEFSGFKSAITNRPDGYCVKKQYHQDYFRKGRVSNEYLYHPETGIFWFRSNTWSDPWEGEQYSPVQLMKQVTNREGVEVTRQYTYHWLSGLPETETVTDNSAINYYAKTTSHYAYFGGNTWRWRKTDETLTNIDGNILRQKIFNNDEFGDLVELIEKCSYDGQNQSIYTHFDYDNFGNLISKTDPEGRVTRYPAYDPYHLYPTEIQYPSTTDPDTGEVTAHTVTIEGYDYRYGLPTRSVDSNGTITKTTYDGFGRVLSSIQTDSGGEQLSREAYAYNDTSLSGSWQFPYQIIHHVYDSENGTLSDTTRFDGMGRKIIASQSWWDSLPRTQRYYYDKMGRLSSVKGPYLGHDNFTASVPQDAAVTTTEYDAFDRPTKVTTLTESGNPAVTEYQYDGYLTTITDPDQVKRLETRDGPGHIIKIWEPGSKENDVEDIVTHYTYNVAGDLTEVVKTNLYGDTSFGDNETKPVKWTMAYDTLGRKRRMEDPDMGVWTYTYYKDGQLASQTDEKDQTISLSYDELGRLSEKAYSSGAPSVQYRYDKAANGIGRLYTVTSGNGDVVRGVDAYDGLGRERVTRTLINGDQPRLTEYDYNQAGLLKTIKYPSSDGYTVTYDYYGNCGLVRSVSDADGVLAEFREYPALGGVGDITYGNTVQTVQQYSPYSGRLASIRTTAAGGPIVNQAYTYTAAGDISTLTDSGVTATYSYDNRHRLTGESDNGGGPAVTPMVIDFFYDDAGPLHAPSEITLNGQPHTVGYDENGNTTSLADMTNPNAVAERTISYNADNMPVSVTHAAKGTTDFLYDGDGQRAKKSGAGGTTNYVSDLFEVKDGVETSYVFANGLRIAQVTATGKKFLHADHLGSTVAVTDEEGKKLEGKQYTPYGLTRGTDDIEGAAYQFTDQERDTSTGLYNYDARLYDPVIGRFLSADSIVPYPLNPQSYNRYSYVLNNPLGFTDPTGHEPTNAKDANGIGVSDTGMLESISESYGSWDDKVGGENDATAAVVRWWATNPRWRVGSTQYVSKLSFVLNQLLDQGYDITGLTIDTIDGLFEDIRDYYTSINSGAAAGILLGGAQGLANRTIKKTPEGIVYKRTNPFDGEEYIGQSKSPSRFNARQGEHDNALGVQHEYEIIGRAEPGRPLDVLEESAIRQNGGIQKRGGHLANKRHQMSEERYRNAGGTVSLPY